VAQSRITSKPSHVGLQSNKKASKAWVCVAANAVQQQKQNISEFEMAAQHLIENSFFQIRCIFFECYTKSIPSCKTHMYLKTIFEVVPS
jgi:hypothetical protein